MIKDNYYFYLILDLRIFLVPPASLETKLSGNYSDKFRNAHGRHHELK